jgi:hypothetical protein
MGATLRCPELYAKKIPRSPPQSFVMIDRRGTATGFQTACILFSLYFQKNQVLVGIAEEA